MRRVLLALLLLVATSYLVVSAVRASLYVAAWKGNLLSVLVQGTRHQLSGAERSRGRGRLGAGRVWVPSSPGGLDAGGPGRRLDGVGARDSVAVQSTRGTAGGTARRTRPSAAGTGDPQRARGDDRVPSRRAGVPHFGLSGNLGVFALYHPATTSRGGACASCHRIPSSSRCAGRATMQRLRRMAPARVWTASRTKLPHCRRGVCRDRLGPFSPGRHGWRCTPAGALAPGGLPGDLRFPSQQRPYRQHRGRVHDAEVVGHHEELHLLAAALEDPAQQRQAVERELPEEQQAIEGPVQQAHVRQETRSGG